jgi:hypothetical protein
LNSRSTVPLAILALVALASGLIVGSAAASSSVRTAAPPSSYTFDRLHKVLILGLAPGQIITVYGVDGSETPTFTSLGEPSGQRAGVYIQSSDGKPMEIYVPWSSVAAGPAARQSRFFLWSADQGWKLIGAVTPLEAWPDTQILAQ